MNLRLPPLLTLLMACLLLPLATQAQNVEAPPPARPSPLMMARTNLGNGTAVVVTYGAPRRNERAIFGGLVPLGEVWRLGANEATHLITSGPIRFGGELLQAGAYTLFAVPHQDRWEVIINRQIAQWGTQYNERTDLARIDVPTQRAAMPHEALAMRFEETEGGADLHIVWDDTHVAVPIHRVYAAPDARPSPTSIAQTTLSDGTYMKITYSSPLKRGRTIFGELLPYGQEWRLGANEATELTLTGDVELGGQSVAAGTYALFAVPSETAWEIIISRELGLWGNFGRDTSMDVARLRVPVMKTGEQFEALTIAFRTADDATHLIMAWDDVQVRVPVVAK